VPVTESETVERLLRRYTELIDAGDFDAIGVLFADGRIATEDGSVVATGASEVSALYETTTLRHGDGTPRTRHLTTNIVVDVEPRGDAATAESDFVVVQRVDADDPMVVVAAGHYVDQLARTSTGWHFVERRMVPQLFGDVSRHLTFDPRPSRDAESR
jgi:hypothetical protein